MQDLQPSRLTGADGDGGFPQIERIGEEGDEGFVRRPLDRGSGQPDVQRRAAIGALTRRAWEGGGRQWSESRLSASLLDEVDRGARGSVAAAPVLVVVGADTRLGLPQTVGESVFPAVQNVLLAATALGLGSALTTAAGVAGGMVVGNALMGLFSPHPSYGGGFGGMPGASPWGAAPGAPGQDFVDQGTWDTGGAPAQGQGAVDQGTWDQPDPSGGDSGGDFGSFDPGGGSDDSLS